MESGKYDLAYMLVLAGNKLLHDLLPHRGKEKGRGKRGAHNHKMDYKSHRTYLTTSY